MGKTKRSCILIFFVLLMLFAAGMHLSMTKLTYLEYITINDVNDTYITPVLTEKELIQEFIMPYDILDSISIQIGTFQKDSNSTWQFSITDNSRTIIYQDSFNADLVSDNEHYKYNLNKKLILQKGDKYFIHISATDISNMCGNPCFKIYGGDIDYWWCGFIIVLSIYLLILILRIYWLDIHGYDIRNDKYIHGMAVGTITFILWCTFAVKPSFLDENDNILGGMIIANGGVLYRDYITQHTPVAYYLCSIFAIFGASSVEQFRLSYYFLEAIIWCCLYVRHHEYFGKSKMLILPVLESICILSTVSIRGHLIFSDGLQGLLFVILMLEFIRYYDDKLLNLSRCIIISICFWGSIGAAFISVYALIWIVIIVICLEINYWKSNKANLSLHGLCIRYYKLFISLVIPFMSAFIYFAINHSCRIAFEQFYTFNREVYPKYISLGDKILQPFANSIQNFYSIIVENFNAIVTFTANKVVIIQLAIIVTAAILIIRLFVKKEYIIGMALLLVMIFSAPRGYELHGLPAWYIAVMIVAIYYDLIEEILHRMGKPMIAIFSVILLIAYLVDVRRNLLFEKPAISALESNVIKLTENDENMDIFLEATYCEPVYFFYKNRKPVNTAVYMLPWYMEWYEKDNIYTLLEENPKIVVYNEDRDIWGYTHYTTAFDTELKNNYIRLGDEDWEYNVWIKK